MKRIFDLLFWTLCIAWALTSAHAVWHVDLFKSELTNDILDKINFFITVILYLMVMLPALIILIIGIPYLLINGMKENPLSTTYLMINIFTAIALANILNNHQLKLVGFLLRTESPGYTSAKRRVGRLTPVPS